MDTHRIHHNRLMLAYWTLFAVLSVHLARSASVYSNIDVYTNPNIEPICNEQQERFIDSEGRKSSLILELHPGLSGHASCKRILSAPDGHGFFVTLIRPKIQKPYHNAHSGPLIKNVREMRQKNANLTRSCPLSVFSSIDPHTPSMKIDPCQMEDVPDQMDPVRLLSGRLRIIWEHGGNTLASKLMVTVLGKAAACQDENKHPCLKIGSEPLLCISKDLVCDGIRHCPNSNEYDSDEDYKLCAKRRKFVSGMESDVWEHWTIEIFRNLFASDTTYVPTMVPTTTPTSALKPSAGTKVQSKTMAEKTPPGRRIDPALMAEKTTPGRKTDPALGGIVGHKRNSTRLGLSTDLSKYGPWGYLMLGMLLCGGALLICGLWASASNGQNDGDSGQQANASLEHQAPPNYEELDPPPAYSALFPIQKALAMANEPVAGPYVEQSESSSTSDPPPPPLVAEATATTTTVAS